MPSLRAAIDWIANNEDVDLGSEEDGYVISVYLVADLFDREPADIARAVGHERLARTGVGWRLGRKV